MPEPTGSARFLPRFERRRRGLTIYGHFGGWNAGDEAILSALVTAVRLEAPSLPISVILIRQNDRGRGLCAELGVEAVPLKSFASLRHCLRYQLWVGGGQMLTGDGSRRGLAVVAGLAGLNRIGGHRPRLVFCGVEGIRSRRSRALVRLIGGLMSSSTLRDQNSYDAMLASGASSHKLRRAPDVVLGATLPTAVTPAAGGPTPHILVVPHRSPIRTILSTDHLVAALQAMRHLGPIAVLSHDGRPEYDDGIVDDLAPLASDGLRLEKFTSLAITIEHYSSAKVVVSARMHPLILAIAFGIPLVALAGSSKVANLAERVGAPVIDPSDAEAIAHAARHGHLVDDTMRESFRSQVRDEMLLLLA